MAINLPGIDEGIFHDLLEDDEDLFVTILSTFVEKTPVSLSKLANPSTETLEEYSKIVHGVKGACANICAEPARQAAFRLEQMSRAGDLAGVQAENGPFLKTIEDLIERAKNWLKDHK